MCGLSGVKQAEIHKAKPLVPESSAFDVGMGIEKLKGINRQVFAKFQQSLCMYDAGQCVLRSVNL
jgi:hypothetical protein